VGRWVDDKTITARVKARLTATGFASLTRIHVDTYEGRVYLTGAVTRPELKQRIEELVATVPGVDQVIANLPVAPALVSLAAAAEGEPMPAVLPRLDDRHPLLRRLRLGRLEVETGTPGWTQYAAYDPAGRLVATGVFDDGRRDASARRGRPPPGGPTHRSRVDLPHARSSAGAYYDVVLWHVPRDDMAPLQ
jgi:hypothetical protein